MTETNTVELITKTVLDGLGGAWKLAKGRGAVDRTLEQFWTYSGLTRTAGEGKNKVKIAPILARVNKAEYGYHLILHLFPGIWIGDLWDRQPALAAALGGELKITEDDSGWVHVRVYTRQVPRSFPYRSDLSGIIKKYPLAIPIGIGRPGFLSLHLADDVTFCMLVGGMPGAGKSVFLRQALHSVIMNYSPVEVELFLVDMKLGVEFACFQAAPHVRDWAGDLPGALRVLTGAVMELGRRAKLFQSAGAVNLDGYNGIVAQKLGHVIIAIDEFASLDKKCIGLVEVLARAGRFAGMHPIICTQQARTEVVPGSIKALLPVSVCFKTKSKLESRIILGDGCNQAVHLRGQGRAWLQTPENLREVQVMFIDEDRCRQEIKAKYGQAQTVQLMPKNANIQGSKQGRKQTRSTSW